MNSKMTRVNNKTTATAVGPALMIFCNSGREVALVNETLGLINDHGGTPAEIVERINGRAIPGVHVRLHVKKVGVQYCRAPAVPIKVELSFNQEDEPKAVPDHRVLPEDGTATCSICISQVDPMDMLSPSVVTQCGHAFHLGCLQGYFEKTFDTRCPNCRHPCINQGLSIIHGDPRTLASPGAYG